MGASVPQPHRDGGKLSQESGALLPARLLGWERLGRGCRGEEGAAVGPGSHSHNGGQLGVPGGFVICPAFPSPCHPCLSFPITEGLCWGMGAMEEADEAPESCPRDAPHCACSHPGPLSSACPPGGTGDPSPLTGCLCKVRRVMVTVGTVTLGVGAALTAGPARGWRDPPVLRGRDRAPSEGLNLLRCCSEGYGQLPEPRCPRAMGDTKRGKTPPGTRPQGHGQELLVQAGSGQTRGEPRT